MRHREPAICLRATDFSETSQVVHFLTRGAGLVKLLAKGAKRPKSSSGGAIDLTNEGDLVFITSPRDALGTLIEFSETDSHSGLRTSAERLNAALYAVELAGEMLAEGDVHVEVFDLLHNTLARLDKADSPPQAVLAFFQWRLLRHVGLLGELRACVSCGRPTAGTAAELHFSSSQGGLLCPQCEGAAPEKYRLDGATLGALAALRAVDSGARGVALGDRQARAVNRMLAYHVAQQLGKPMRMARHAIG